MSIDDDKSPKSYQHNTLNTVNVNTESLHEISALDRIKNLISGYSSDTEDDVRFYTGRILKILENSDNEINLMDSFITCHIL